MITGLFPWQVALGSVVAMIVAPFCTAFLAMLGVLISTRAKTTLRASVHCVILAYMLIYPPMGLVYLFSQIARVSFVAVAILAAIPALGVFAGITNLLYRWACYRFRNVRSTSR